VLVFVGLTPEQERGLGAEIVTAHAVKALLSGVYTIFLHNQVIYRTQPNAEAALDAGLFVYADVVTAVFHVSAIRAPLYQSVNLSQTTEAAQEWLARKHFLYQICHPSLRVA
jgi:hypothetical protein